MTILELIKQAAEIRQRNTRARTERPLTKGFNNAPRPEFAFGQVQKTPVFPTGPMQATDQILPNIKNLSPKVTAQVLTANAVNNIGPGQTQKAKAKPAAMNPAGPSPSELPAPIHDAQIGNNEHPTPTPTRHQRGTVNQPNTSSKTELKKSWPAPAQTLENITNTKAIEPAAPPMTTLPQHTSSHPTANTSLVARDIASATSNPLHQAEATSNNVGKLRQFINKYPYGTATAALAIMAAGTAVLAKSKYETEEQRKLNAKKNKAKRSKG